VILQSLVVAFLVTLAATPVVRAAAGRLHLLDHPNERSSHRTVTPRSGGLAIALGLAVAGALVADHRAASIATGGLLLVVVGVLDDRYGLSPWPRLACQALAASIVVGTAGGLERLPLPRPLDAPLGPLGGALAVVWIVAVVNFYNFMDGIDGLAGLQGVVTAATAALALAGVDPPAAAIGAALAGACIGFLPFNWPPASVFLGDAGSGLIGYTLATLPFVQAGEGRCGLVVLVGTSLFLFLADATTCLVRRVARRERWYEAHREHLYQRWVRAGARHGTVTAWLGLGALATCAPALAGWTTGRSEWGWVALGVGAAAFAWEWTRVKRLERGVGREA
jgi:Fuc2NAc and GlcNAc transferase